MTATEIINNLSERGVHVWADGEAVKLKADRKGVITDADRADVAAVKAEILRLLTRPALGSIRRPLTVRGRKLERCPFDGCAGEINHHEHSNLKLCGRCGWYFELLPPQEGDLCLIS